MNNMTLKEAVELWVNRDMTAIPLSVVEKLIKISEYNDILEITPVSAGCRAWSNDYQDVCKVISTFEKETEDGEFETFALVDFDEDVVDDDSKEIELPIEDLSREEQECLPMWGVMWAFNDSCDQNWVEDNLNTMAACGFRIYESEDFGYIFGIDGAGYDFYSEHWIPLYKARGLQWHIN